MKYKVFRKNNIIQVLNVNNVYYTYDSAGKLVSMNISTKISETSWSTPTEYFYVRNAQNDIIGLIDKAGTQVVSYNYDSWGKLVSIEGPLKDTVGVKNPYLYRGYRFDTETGLYYLQSRYYNPEWGRFINADAIAGSLGELLGHNIFAYTKNNPISMSDPSGFRPVYTMDEETDEMREASYKVMEKYERTKSKDTRGVITTKTASGYTKHVADAGIASATAAYGPTGGYAAAQINTPDFPIQGYWGQSAIAGAAWNGDNKWNIYEMGLDASLYKAGGIGKIDIGIFHCEIQLGVSVGLGGSLTVGGYNDNSGFGGVLGGSVSWFPGAEASLKMWIEH